MFQKLKRLFTTFSLTGVLVFALILILGASAARSAAAQPIGLSSAPAPLQSTAAFTIGLQLVDNGLAQPVYVTSAGDDSGRLFVVERAGLIRVIKNGAVLGSNYLNIQTRVESGGDEQGLLSMAFDPNYKTNGTFYVNYTTDASGHDGDTIIARYIVSNPLSDTAVILTVTHLITIFQPETNHNGGQIQFGPNDDYLYIGMGDGGGGGDQHGTIGNGQDLSALLGKILRIDVRGVPTYTIPASNPFTQTAGAKKEIWAYGVRNPWRFSFDRATGDMYIGDVGQNCWEEIDYQPASDPGGLNYGWRLMEGLHTFDPNSPNNCSQPTPTLITLTKPITNYNHTVGSVALGGYVYRGVQYPCIQGIYFFADYGTGEIWSEQQIAPGVWSSVHQLYAGFSISSFGEDQDGELYAVEYGGAIHKLVSSCPANLSSSTKSVSPNLSQSGGGVTYTIVLRNLGSFFNNTLRVTDTLPGGLSYVSGSFTSTRGTPDASSAPTLKWSGSMSNTFVVTLTYRVTVSTGTPQVLTNSASIDPGFAAPFTRTAVIIVNGVRVYLPIVLKNY